MVVVSIAFSSLLHARRAHNLAGPRRDLFLAFRAPKGRAAVLRKAPHDAVTAGSLAFLALAVVDLERMLEIAELAVGLAMIAQRRSASLDGLVQHRVDRRHQAAGVIGRLALFCRERCGQPSRRQMGTKKCLADIDVAETCDHALV